MNRAPSDQGAAERRREIVALAANPFYSPRPNGWRCFACSWQNEAAAVRCTECLAMGPSWLPEAPAGGLEAPRTPVIVRIGRGHRGQALVELALVLPVMLFTALGFLEAGFLVAAHAAQDRSTAVVVDWAADHPGEAWQPVGEAELPGCDVTVAPDPGFPDILRAESTCTYVPRVTSNLWDGLPMSSSESAATEPAATPSPSATP